MSRKVVKKDTKLKKETPTKYVSFNPMATPCANEVKICTSLTCKFPAVKQGFCRNCANDLKL